VARVARQVTVKRCDGHVIIDCNCDIERTSVVWQQLNDDISRSTLGGNHFALAHVYIRLIFFGFLMNVIILLSTTAPYEGSPAMPSWIRTWVVTVADDVMGM
jgi:hypothetical protein